MVVIGSGGAGLRAACAAAAEGRRTLLVSRGSPALGSATLLSDGFFSSTGPGMSAAEHERLTMETGYHRNKPELVKVLVEEARPRIEELARRGARFQEENGGMRVPRRTWPTGMGILTTLKAWAEEAGVSSVGWTTVVDLLMDEDRVAGCYALAKGKPLLILAGATILCTGGASALFLLHDNPITSLGDGYAMAARAGVALEDMEFIQFYPLITNQPGTPRTLIMPPLTDLGKLINDKEEDLVEKYGLAPFRPLGLRARDRLSRALFQEHLAGRRVFLDLRMMTEGDWQDPAAGTGLKTLFETRYHSHTAPVSITPAAHFTMGGIPIDEHGKTTVAGLFAAGEVTCGLHGANRLGGNALSETLVFGARAGMAAAMSARPLSGGGEKAAEAFAGTALSSGDSPSTILTRIKETLWKYCGPVRTGEGLARGTDILNALEERALGARTPGEASLRASVRNAFFVARRILEAARARKESLGAHYRED